MTTAADHSLRSAAAQGAQLVSTRSVATDQPALHDALRGSAPWLPGAIEALRDGLPVAPTVTAFAAPPFFRPPGSHRCFYYCPATAPGADPEMGSGVIAFKGVEPCVQDLDVMLQDFRRAYSSPYNIAEHLIFEEQKVPGCLLLTEAEAEYDRAIEVQIAHLAAFGSLARLPIPLFVLRHNEPTVAASTDLLRGHLADSAFSAVQRQLVDGLAVYVYYYPSPAVRVRDIDALTQGMPFKERMLTVLANVGQPGVIIDGWVDTFARMLQLGFLPGTLTALHTGVCCQPQNACIDGGFVDLGSVVPIDQAGDDTAIFAALQFSFDSLFASVRTLLVGGANNPRPETLDLRPDLHYLREYLLDRLRRRLSESAPASLAVDDRLTTYFAAPRSLDELVNRLSTYYSSSSAFDEAARDFSDFGMSIIRRSLHR